MLAYIYDKKHQKKVTRWVTLISAAVLAYAGIWGGTWLIKGANLNTARELNKSSELKGYGALWLIALIAFAGYSAAPIRKPKKQWAIRSYTSVLFLWAAIFAALAVKIPSDAQKYVSNVEWNCNVTQTNGNYIQVNQSKDGDKALTSFIR